MNRETLEIQLFDLLTEAIRAGVPLHEVLVAQAAVLLRTTSLLGDQLADHGYASLPTRELVARVLDVAEAPGLAVVPDPE